MHRIIRSIYLLVVLGCLQRTAVGESDLHVEFRRNVEPLLTTYCLDCHQGDDANGDVAFDAPRKSWDSIASSFELWESVSGHLMHRTMPPDDSPQPSDEDRQGALDWYTSFVSSIESRPAVLKPRRLSVIEYRNTLTSLLGFDLETAAIEAEQTDFEKSLVVKLLPIDPPGRSGFTNDTNANPLTTIAWDQYTYLIDTALEQLFSAEQSEALERYTGPGASDGKLNFERAATLIRRFSSAAVRRPLDEAEVEKAVSRLQVLRADNLTKATKFELKSILLSPSFLYRGFLVEGQRGILIDVDNNELAERLSYFLWADMPDAALFAAAERGELSDPKLLQAQVDRMLASPKARRLSEVFVSEWFTLSEIDVVSDNPPIRDALKSQPIDFMHFLFTNDRPLTEMVDSNVSFINAHTSRFYRKDAKQLERHERTRGIEIEDLPNQQIEIRSATERGGLLTMPGILMMNRGPILRGTWILERILGEHLPDPPANVGQVAANVKGENLTFRQRFEQHRSSQACAVCHDKIDPLGFSLQSFSNNGQYDLAANNQSGKGKTASKSSESLDSSGQLPTGETFANATELKKILSTTQRQSVIRNIVERTMSYALCRKLEVFDRPTVDAISDQMMKHNGTWRDLFAAISASVPFRQTILSNRG